MTIDPTVLAPETELMTAAERSLKPTATTEAADDVPDVVMDGCPEYWIG